MDSGSAQDGRQASSREERNRQNPLRQEVLRSRQGFEKVDPTPVAVLGPLPSLREQVREALLQDPETVRGWLEQESLESQNFDPMDFEEEDPDPEWISGHEIVDMQDEEPASVQGNHPPEDQAEAGAGAGSGKNGQHPLVGAANQEEPPDSKNLMDSSDESATS